jgi:hypothetical protein
MEHCSINSDVLWYVDSITEKKDGKYAIQGWIFHRKHQIKNVFIGSEKVKLYSRTDVAETYSDNRFPDNTGFKVSINDSSIDTPIVITLGDDTEIKIESLSKFFVYYSGFNNNHKNLIVVDNFYYNPDLIREYAINKLDFQNSDYHRGKRSNRFVLKGTKERLEHILGRTILNWNSPSYANGVFQYCTSYDPIVYHVDSQQFAGVVFLTPNAPLDSGTATYRSKITGATRFEDNDELYEQTFKGVSNELNFYDSTSYEVVDKVANVFNRLVLWDAKAIHAATNYFGDNINNARFFQLFFFDVE